MAASATRLAWVRALRTSLSFSADRTGVVSPLSSLVTSASRLMHPSQLLWLPGAGAVSPNCPRKHADASNGTVLLFLSFFLTNQAGREAINYIKKKQA